MIYSEYRAGIVRRLSMSEKTVVLTREEVERIKRESEEAAKDESEQKDSDDSKKKK
jgi:hypothetical protein